MIKTSIRLAPARSSNALRLSSKKTDSCDVEPKTPRVYQKPDVVLHI